MKIVVTGITGFVGGLVTAELLKSGHEVIGISRDPTRCRFDVPVVCGDIAADASWAGALEGAQLAYYLVHSFGQDNREGFAVRDRRAAQRFAGVAKRAGVERIVYCGVSAGSAPGAMSPHRRSRCEVEDILLSALPNSVSMRTWTVLAPDNQFIRLLVAIIRARSTLILPPSRAFRFRPIDGRNLGQALAAAVATRELCGQVVDLAGTSTISNEELYVGLAHALGLRRKLLRLPFDPPNFMLKAAIRSAGQDRALILAALESANAGDVLPASDTLQRLVPKLYRLDESLAYAVDGHTMQHAGSPR